MANRPTLQTVRVRFLRLILLALCLSVVPAAARAANNCPWVNESTASGLVGGNAVGSYTAATGGQPAVCTFTQQDAGGTRTLQVIVEIASDPHARLMQAEQACGTDGQPLHAIGNEAIFCAADQRSNQRGERALGRVRDQVFTITISSSIKDDSILTRDELKMRIYTAAEQVAGNLF